MLKRDLVKLIGGILLGGVVILGALPACGGSTSGMEPLPTAPQTTAPIPESPVPSLESNDNVEDILAQGKLIFEETAGGVGCASCHGLEARGGGAGPDIRGVEETQIREAIKGGVPAMSFIKLSEEGIMAVAVYIQHLSEQPDEMD